MTAGSVLGAVAVAGIATSGLFYPPAFAALTARYGDRRVQALTVLTLTAGFASTIFAPLASTLATHLGWRGTYLVLAAALAVRVPWPAGQVAGRLGYRRLASGLGLRARAAVVIAAVAVTTFLVGLLPGPAILLIAGAVLAGAARGVFTLTEATVVSDYWGPDRCAVLNGVFNAPIVAAGALLAATAPSPAKTPAQAPARTPGQARPGQRTCRRS
jgi:MFS family permease